jgi:hypothetical protein
MVRCLLQVNSLFRSGLNRSQCLLAIEAHGQLFGNPSRRNHLNKVLLNASVAFEQKSSWVNISIKNCLGMLPSTHAARPTTEPTVAPYLRRICTAKGTKWEKSAALLKKNIINATRTNLFGFAFENQRQQEVFCSAERMM